MSGVFVFRQPPQGFITEYFGGGGKGGTSTSTVSIPPEVLARYNAVNARAEETAKQPFQQYGGEFVAPVNEQQRAGMQGVNALAGKNVGPLTQEQIGYYQNPAMLATLAPTQAALQQQQGQQLAQQQAEAIKAGAWGGSGASNQRQLLRGQQQLGMGQALAPIYQQAYQTGLQTAGQQQGVVAQDLARQMQTAQAQMAAGQVGQQTQQAQDTAKYQQFLQERGYPFQISQFLANIAMGTGALSGSTTTSQQPGGFFSDKRLKEDVKEIGETNDGQPIYSYKYKGDDRTQIGLMAQDVEKKHPEAVGLMGGYKTVDYKKATEGAERPHKDMGGGLMPNNFDTSSMGGAVTSGMAGEGFERGGYVGGGLVGNDDWSQIIAANKAALGVYGGAQPMGGSPGATGIVPAASIPTPKLVTASAPSQQRPAGLSSAMQTGKDIAGAYKMGKEGLIGSAPTKDDPTGSAGLWGGQGKMDGQNIFSKGKDFFSDMFKAEGGLITSRHAYADGGGDDSQGEEAVPYDPSDVMGGKDPMEGVLKAGSQKHEMLKPSGTGGGGGGGSGLGIGKMAGSVIGSAFGPLGSMAGSALGSLLPFAEGGLVPRQGYALEGAVDEIPAQATESPVEQVPVDDRLDRTLGALKRIESGGRYDITGPASRKGDRPYGAYQIMGANVPSWTEAALGRRMTPDEFLKDQSAQDTTAKHRAGLYLKQYDDPRQVASMWLSGKPIEKAGNVADVLGTDVPKYVSMFDRYYGGQDLAPDGRQATGLKPPADIGRTSSGGEGKKSLGDTLTSEGFIVPALGFLGSMLASDKRNLGQALGEGIMGGVGAYQQQRKMLPEIAKTEAEASQQNVAAINALSSGLKRYNALNGTNLTLQQFAQLTPAQIAKYAGASAASAVSGQSTSSGGYTYDPDEPEKLVIKRPGQSDIPAHSDPAYLTAFKAHWVKLGDDPYAQKLIAWADKQLEESKTSTISSTGERIPAPGAIETAQKGEVGKGLAKEALDFNQEKRMFMQESPKILTSVNQIADIVSRFPTGVDVTARANLDRIMKSIDPKNEFGLWTGAAGDYDTMVKNAMIIGLSQLKGLSPRAPAAELEAIKRQIPEGKMDPEAIRNILSGLKADVEYKKKMYNSFDIDKHTNVNKVLSEFMEKEPYDEFVKQTKKELKPGAGTQQQREQAVIPQNDLVAGKIYKDASGNQMRYTASGGWEKP
jgi:hypothetical protein